jgi:hypothetical protein
MQKALSWQRPATGRRVRQWRGGLSRQTQGGLGAMAELGEGG